MTAIHSLEDLDRFRQEVIAEKQRLERSGMIQAIVSMGSCGIAAGAQETYDTLQKLIEREHLQNVMLSKTGCIGLCSDEPILQVVTSDGLKTTYGHAIPEFVERVVHDHILGGKIVRDQQIIG